MERGHQTTIGPPVLGIFYSLSFRLFASCNSSIMAFICLFHAFSPVLIFGAFNLPRVIKKGGDFGFLFIIQALFPGPPASASIIFTSKRTCLPRRRTEPFGNLPLAARESIVLAGMLKISPTSLAVNHFFSIFSLYFL